MTYMNAHHPDVGPAPVPVDGPDAPLLRVRGLTVGVSGSDKEIVRGVDLDIRQGEVLAIVGESGSGKSVTALALAQLLPRGLQITGGSVQLDQTEMVGQDEATLTALRGTELSMLFQQPQTMLDPTARVDAQVAEPLWRKERLRGRGAFGRVVDLLRGVGIPDPEARARCYSHELSGGMAQRVMMACAMAGSPRLLIADEPTTALDVTVQAQILRLLRDTRDRHNLSILLITHDLAVVAAFADRVAVMYAGRIVEEGPARQIMTAPAHPYTRALVRCSLLEPDAHGRLASIGGSSSLALDLTQGCRFAPRCAAMHQHHGLEHSCCSDEPAMQPVGDGWHSRCHASCQTGGRA
ncbi:MAG: ABC transporter ATP-binding protein [Paracoccus sp. (in: a-proteobacteria)]